MSPSDSAVLFEQFHRVLDRWSSDPELRAFLRLLGQTLLETTSEGGSASYASATSSGSPIPTPPPEMSGSPLRRIRMQAAGSRGSDSAGGSSYGDEGRGDSDSYRYGSSDYQQRGRGTQFDSSRSYGQEKFVPVDFNLIEQRCRLKAEGARWAVARRRLLANRADFTTDVEPLDRDLIARAKMLPNCFLWLNHPNGPSSTDPSRYDEVAACFETLAEAVSLVRAIDEDRDRDPIEFEAALNLLAEAQSMLRISVVKFDNYADTDQRDVFQWLKHTANEQQIFIRRFMRLDDPGDPLLAVDLQNRIKASSGSILESRKKVKQHKKLLSKLKHKCQLIQEDPSIAGDYWEVVFPMVDELIDGGIPVGNRELREAIEPILELIPVTDDLPRAVQSVVKEIERQRNASAEPEYIDDPNEELSESTAHVAAMLHEKSLFLIGGERNEAAEDRLRKAFDLRELYWVSANENESPEGLEAFIAKPDVALVVLSIRSSNQTAHDAKVHCEKHGKPLVRLPSGFGPNQIATQVVAQCSDKL